MHVYKELNFIGNKEIFDEMFFKIYDIFPSDWIKPEGNHLLNNYILADYIGNKVPHAEVSIYYGEESWRDGVIRVGNIVPLEKDQLSIDEYNEILDLFYKEIIKPYGEMNKKLRIIAPTSEQFDPLKYITEEALEKLTNFCNLANKSTGSTHPCDEQRWFDFICQTVDDNKLFDYDMLFKFLTDEDYWGRKKESSIGVIGKFAWNEENAEELASEYENYVRILQYYKKTRGKVNGYGE